MDHAGSKAKEILSLLRNPNTGNALVYTLIQSGTEELIFRGHL